MEGSCSSLLNLDIRFGSVVVVGGLLLNVKVCGEVDGAAGVIAVKLGPRVDARAGVALHELVTSNPAREMELDGLFTSDVNVLHPQLAPRGGNLHLGLNGDVLRSSVVDRHSVLWVGGRERSRNFTTAATSKRGRHDRFVERRTAEKEGRTGGRGTVIGWRVLVFLSVLRLFPTPSKQTNREGLIAFFIQLYWTKRSTVLYLNPDWWKNK